MASTGSKGYGFNIAGAAVGSPVGTGTLVAGDPLLGVVAAGMAVAVADEPQATAAASIIAASVPIRNGGRNKRA